MGGTWRRLVAVATAAIVTAGSTTAAKAPGRDEPEGHPTSYLSGRPGPGYFPLVAKGKAAPIVVSGQDHRGVVRVAGDLRADIERVTGVRPAVSTGAVPRKDAVVLIGTIGKSPLIDGLVRAGKLNVNGIAGRWETSLQQVVDDPMPGVERAFVIAGSDQRGTIFGVYDVSKNAGVSPWYWWDDVPARKSDALYVKPGRHTQGTPAVKYRGFFINDENPALGRWARKFFGDGHAPGHPGGFTSELYAKVFETMLRLKANYLWPAVWGRAFAEDDPRNHATASEYGVVMGTSHEAPMMRGIEEWNRHAKAAVRDENGDIVEPGHDPYGGTGEWSFRRNRAAIEAYWREGIRRKVRQGFEGVVTLGMRGNGDTSLPDGDAIELMQDIIATQRRIIQEETGRPTSETPQVWTLYKEVQRYWDRGLRAPDDVTVVYADDNWGNMRKMPDLSAPPRSGGYGLYYHYDYVGGGRNYKWVDTTQLANTWEQLHQSYQYGIRNLWAVNVGDMKNQEMPLQFFLDYAWNPSNYPLESLGAWERDYAAQNFGTRNAAEIAEVLHEYGDLQALRKPELTNRRITVDPDKDLSTDPSAVVYDDKQTPYYLNQHQEMDAVTERWRRLAAKADRLRRRIPGPDQDAFYQLVYYQVKATSLVYEIRQAEFTSILYARQGRAATNDHADLAERKFDQLKTMNDYYNNRLAGGKWKDFQTQPVLGYGDVERYGPNAPWQQPELNNEALPDEIFPPVRRHTVPNGADMGVGIDGSDKWWPDERGTAVLPEFSPYRRGPAQYIEVFNRGATPFDYRITPSRPWVKVTPAKGRVGKQIRATVRIDWDRAPKGTTRVPITVSGAGRTVTVEAVVTKPAAGRLSGFVEAGGYVSMDGDGYTRAVGTSTASWKRIPGIGRTDAGMTPVPVTAPSRQPGRGPRLEYETTLFTTGPVKVWVYLSPRNPVLNPDGLRYAVSVDGGTPQVVNITRATGADDTSMNRQWERNTSDNVNRTVTTHQIAAPGRHTVKVWMVDPTVVVQKVVIDTGGLPASYLGPPESLRAGHGR
ncbi:glycosyl hydrolase 115 family protein [Actinomadura sp. SCN-SB]|uniref:glycosyl hydrolase 115 family protein n=1 Tax=Actinomadura sp. SCN-SB TaxID=3373092 RepID=UPI003750A330